MTRITRDHHLLTRNLKLNGNYISNDGGDEGISILDNGAVSMTAYGTTDKSLTITSPNLTTGNALLLDVNDSLTASATKSLLVVDYDKSGVTATGQLSKTVGSVINLEDAATNHVNSFVQMIGSEINVSSANNQGTIIQTGLILKVASDGVGDAGTTLGIVTDVMDGGIDIKMQSEDDSNDYCSMATGALGATTITTVDNGGEEADLTLNIDGFIDINSATTGEDITLDAGGDIILDADGGNIYIKHGDTSFGYFNTATGGTLKLKTPINYGISLDTAGTGDIVLDSSSDIVLDSNDGNFIMKNAGTEFSVANSAYAGMILGYTALGIDSADASYTTTTSWAVVDSTAKVSFVAPPSGNVEIFASVYVDTDIGRILEFGLSDNASYSPIDFPNSDDVTNEHSVYRGDETDEEMVSHQWVVTGLTPGTSYEWWFAATSVPSAGAYVLKWGGDVSAEYQPFTMKATALPATIYTG